MLKQHEFYDYSTEENESVHSGFKCEEDAIHALYEQLFDSLNAVCADTILESVRYLVNSKEMDNQIEEMQHMTANDVCVVHHRECDKAREEATKDVLDFFDSQLTQP